MGLAVLEIREKTSRSVTYQLEVRAKWMSPVTRSSILWTKTLQTPGALRTWIHLKRGDGFPPERTTRRLAALRQMTLRLRLNRTKFNVYENWA